MTKLKIIKRFIWFLIVITATIAFSVEIQNYNIASASAAEPTQLDNVPPKQKIKFKKDENAPAAQTTSSKDFIKSLKKTLNIKEPYRMSDIKTFTPDGQKIKICSIDLLIANEEALQLFTDENFLSRNVEIITDILAEKDEDDFVGYGLRSIKEEIIISINAEYNKTIISDINFEKLEIKAKELDQAQKPTPEKESIDLAKQAILDEKINDYLQQEMKNMLAGQVAKGKAALAKIKQNAKKKND